MRELEVVTAFHSPMAILSCSVLLASLFFLQRLLLQFILTKVVATLATSSEVNNNANSKTGGNFRTYGSSYGFKIQYPDKWNVNDIGRDSSAYLGFSMMDGLRT